MEQDHNLQNNRPDNSGKVWAGIFIIGVGAALMLRNVGVVFPHWLFSWSTLLIVIGLFIGLKHRFRMNKGVILILIGLYFTLQDALDKEFDFSKVTLPLIFLVIGLMLIFKSKSSSNCDKRWKRRADWWREKYDNPNLPESKIVDPNFSQDQKASTTNDYVDSVNVFGGSHQTIYSKNFRGGEVVAVFGGCDLNLSQADFDGEIELDVTAIFGGCKIIVPAGWQVKSEVTAIFGGLDDKRSIQPMIAGKQKLLIIRGVAMFGGVDIRNF